MQAFTQEETATRADRRRRCRGRRSSRRPATRSAASRREFANQSSIGVMVTATNRSCRQRRCTFLPDRALHRRRRLGPALQEALLAHRLLGRQQRARRRPRRSSASRRTAATTFSGPDLTSGVARRRRARRSAAPAAQIGDQQDRRRARPLQVATSAFKSPGLRHQRRRLPAPRRRADHGQLAADPQRQAEPLVPQPQRQLQPVRGRGTPTAIGWSAAATSTAHATLRQQLETRRRLQHRRRTASTIARRAAARASTSAASTKVWTWLNTDNRRRAVAESSSSAAARNGDGASWFEVDPSVTYRPMPALTINPAIRVLAEHLRRAVGGPGHRHGEPLRLRRTSIRRRWR